MQKFLYISKFRGYIRSHFLVQILDKVCAMWLWSHWRYKNPWHVLYCCKMFYSNIATCTNFSIILCCRTHGKHHFTSNNIEAVENYGWREIWNVYKITLQVCKNGVYSQGKPELGIINFLNMTEGYVRTNTKKCQSLWNYENSYSCSAVVAGFYIFLLTKRLKYTTRLFPCLEVHVHLMKISSVNVLFPCNSWVLLQIVIKLN